MAVSVSIVANPLEALRVLQVFSLRPFFQSYEPQNHFDLRLCFSDPMVQTMSQSGLRELERIIFGVAAVVFPSRPLDFKLILAACGLLLEVSTASKYFSGSTESICFNLALHFGRLSCPSPTWRVSFCWFAGP